MPGDSADPRKGARSPSLRRAGNYMVTPRNATRDARSEDREMVWVPGGSFRMGSDAHYLEEAPVHSVTVDGFWIDRNPVTNADFLRFVRATGYLTFAEITPKAKDYPGALPHM